MKKTNAILAALAALFTFASAANAQILQTYFDLNSYGTVSGGSTITDATGNTTATLNAQANTSLTSSGLVITGGNSNVTGLTLSSGSLSSFTGSFTIQDWVTASGSDYGVLYGGNSGTVNGYIGDGVGVSTLLGFTWGALPGGNVGVGYVGQYGNGQVADTHAAVSADSLIDLVLTYNASTNIFTQYVNGVAVGTKNDNFSTTSLAGVLNFSIGGAVNQPYNDPASAATTSDFLLYNGALTSSQVTVLHGSGAGASLGTINTDIGVVPEPSTWALILVGFGGLFFVRRSRRSTKG